MSGESPEHLVDAFKAAALSVTKLYKTAASAQAKARSDGYQDCLDDLLAYLDRENIGVGDGEGWKIRRWATERLAPDVGGRAGDSVSQNQESDDEAAADKAETASSPEIQKSNIAMQLSRKRSEGHMRVDSAPPAIQSPAIVATVVSEQEPPQPEIIVPTRETFTFQSSYPFPSDASLNLANLDLSDARTLESGAAPTYTPNTTPRSSRTRHSVSSRSGSRSSNLTRVSAGQKRKLNFAEIFDLASLGYPKDVFGNGSNKRNRHA